MPGFSPDSGSSSHARMGIDLPILGGFAGGGAFAAGGALATGRAFGTGAARGVERTLGTVATGIALGAGAEGVEAVLAGGALADWGALTGLGDAFAFPAVLAGFEGGEAFFFASGAFLASAGLAFAGDFLAGAFFEADALAFFIVTCGSISCLTDGCLSCVHRSYSAHFGAFPRRLAESQVD